MQQVYDSVRKEFLGVPSDAQFVQLSKHCLALIVLAKVFLRAFISVTSSSLRLFHALLPMLSDRESHILQR
jgi:hypothetical protein